jgi:Trypsin
MKTLSSLLPLGWILSAAALLPGQAMALAYFDTAETTATSTASSSAFGYLDGVGYVLTANQSAGNYVACTGAALSSRIILTSSHCFDFNYDNKTDNSRSMFYAWEGLGEGRGLTLHNGDVVVSPQHEIILAGGYKAYSDVALIVLDTPLAATTQTYSVYDGALSGSALSKLEGGAMVVGYGQHHEEGRFIEGGSAYNRWMGYTQVSDFDDKKGGTLSAVLVQGGAALAAGDSGGPLMSWTSSGQGVIFGTAAYARDNQGNGRYSDLGDESFWSFIGEQADFIREVALQYGETISFYKDADLAACRPGSTCPLSGPGSVPHAPEPSEWALLLAGLASVWGVSRLKKRSA